MQGRGSFYKYTKAHVMFFNRVYDRALTVRNYCRHVNRPNTTLVNRGRGRVSNITLILVSLEKGRLFIYKNNENEPGHNCQIFVVLN